jgi:hypothetical protein
MTVQRSLLYFTWIVPTALQAIIVAAMVGRKLYRDFPIFLCYAGFEVINSLACLVIALYPAASYELYFYVSWIGKGIEVSLSFAVIYEIFSYVFHSYDALQRLGSLLFRWCLVILLMLAVVTAASEAGSDASRLISAILLLQRSLSVVQCGLLFFLFLFASYFGVVWRHYVVGITLGFGIFGTVELATSALRTHLGPSFDGVYKLVLPLAYGCSILVWLTYLLKPQTDQLTVQMLPHNQLEDWNQELRQLLLR